MRTQTYPVRRDYLKSQDHKIEFSRLDYDRLHPKIDSYLTRLRSGAVALTEKELAYLRRLKDQLPRRYTGESLMDYRIMGEIREAINTHNRNECSLTQAKIEKRTRELCGLEMQNLLTPEEKKELDENWAYLHDIEWH